ncbi:MAG: HAD family phosphatase [Candidatus Heimdallarchaeota archaeon]|nr:HAD family phosphatase [Candidatus Heimdallarchaeota archaeon]MDH5646388.1 HAD family phosphatase [Candidatus Heimdallarchaeota archaeon]
MKKAVFIDVDGTITDDLPSWEKIHQYFDTIDGMKLNSDKFWSGEFDYHTWAIKDIALWIGKPFNQIRSALLPPKLLDGAREGIQTLKTKGYDVFLISGGIDIFVKEVEKLVGADGSFGNSIGHDNNGIIDGTYTEFVNTKTEIINELVQQHNYDLTQCGAIGDNVNDIEMFNSVGFALAVNTNKEKVISAAQDTFKSKSFLEIVRHFLEKKEQFLKSDLIH